MNKKWKFASFVLTCALFCGVAGTTFVGCKDYDDDIKHLQDQVDGLKTGQLTDYESRIKALEANVPNITTALGEIKTLKEQMADKLGKAEIAGLKNDMEQLKASQVKMADIEAQISAANDALKSELQAAIDGKVNADYVTTAIAEQIAIVNGKLGQAQGLIENLQALRIVDSTDFATKIAGLREDVNSILGDYVKTEIFDNYKAEVYGRFQADSIVMAGMEEKLQDTIDKVAAKFHKFQSDFPTQVARIISDACKADGTINNEIAAQVKKLKDAVDEQFQTLTDKVNTMNTLLNIVAGRMTLTYIPENFHPVVGRVAYLPVIVTDDNSQEKKVYEYNWDNKDFATSMVKGWTAMKYKVNPSNAQLDKDFAVVGFDYNLMNIQKTRSTDNYLEAGKATYANGVVSVEFRDLIPLENGSNYDDPDKESGYKSEYGEAKVGQIALVTKNLRNVEEKVTSDYTSVRRMAVKQEDAMIGIAVGQDKFLKEDANSFTNLSDMYAVAEKDVNGYLKALPVTAEIIWTTEPKLDDYIKDYALKFFTNDDFESAVGQYRLGALGFKNIDFKYSIEEYEAAEVDQTKRYLDLDEETGKIKVKEDPEKPGEKQHAAIDREPVIKVKMFVDGEWIMSKLLKIKFVEKAQLTENWTDTDLKDQTLGCTALIGGGEALITAQSFTGAKTVEGLKIDFDKYFNKLGVSKEKFVQSYSDQGVTGMQTAIKVTKDDKPFSDWSMNAADGNNLIFDASSIYGSAISANNYVYLGLRNQLKAGVYKVVFTFATTNKSAAYRSFTITTSFTVIDPLPMWQANPSMWALNREYMLAYGVATATESAGQAPYIAPYEGPFLMKVAIEDGFMREMKNDGDLKCAHYCFELVDPDQYKGEVSISYDEEEGRHYLTIAQYKDKWVGKKIKVHAFANVTGDHGAKTRTIDVNVDATSSDVFDIMFVDPVSYEENKDYAKNWYLVDKALTTVMDKGAYLPVYELFKLWDTTLGKTNGTMWDGNNWVAVDAIEKGRSLYLMHHVNVTYTLSAKNDPYVLKRASLDEKTGVLKWNNTEGALVGEIDQPIIVEVNIAHQWRAKAVKKELTVFVKKAETAYKQTWPGKENITVANPYGVPGQNDLEILK